jgi:DNA modification methylase
MTPLLLSAFTGPPAVNRVYNTDALTLLRAMADNSVDCVVTSPPYFGLRDYGVAGQIGGETTPTEYVQKLVTVFREVRRVLKPTGTFWLNLGDSYAQDKKWGGSTSGKHASKLHGHTGVGRNRHKTGLPGKNLIGIPWRVAFALQDDGWILRSDIIWNKPNPLPESVTDRPSKSHEYVFLFTKSPRYYYDKKAIKEPVTASTKKRTTQPNLKNQKGSNRIPGKTNGPMKAVVKKQDATGNRQYTGFNDRYFEKEQSDTRNKRTVWTVNVEHNSLAHFATFPAKLIEPMILAGCPRGGIVFDPFMGSGTTALAARGLGRSYLGSELNHEYVQIAQERLSGIWLIDMFDVPTNRSARSLEAVPV